MTTPSTAEVRKLAIVTVVANVLVTFADPFPGDQNFWFTWIEQLQALGFRGFAGNYPPIYVEWLWVVGKVLNLCDLPLRRGFVLKFLCLIPVYLAHLALLRLLAARLQTRPWSAATKRAVLWACVLNPALLAVGPDWGQVDLLPTLFVVASLIACFSTRFARFAFPCTVASLLLKLQMIAFVPVVGILELRFFRRTQKGLPLAAGVVAFALFPFIATGNLRRELTNAYVDSASLYKFASFNAANLWMLLTGDRADWETIPFFPHVDAHRFPLLLLTTSVLGKILFSTVSLAVVVAAWRARRLARAAMLATLMGVSFFFLLPAMHERYLIMAVPVALLWMAEEIEAWPWALLITVTAMMNVSMRNGLSGDGLWRPLSLLVTLTFLGLLLRVLWPGQWGRLVGLAGRLVLPFWAPEALLALSLVTSFVVEYRHTRPVTMKLHHNEAWVTTLPVVEKTQEYGEMRFDHSVDGAVLRTGNTRYRQGIGTHAPSSITFRLPEKVTRFRARAGLDQEARSGKLVFAVRLDGEEVWKSPELTQDDTPVEVDIDVTGKQALTLTTDSLGDMNSDHADWVQARIRFDPKP